MIAFLKKIKGQIGEKFDNELGNVSPIWNEWVLFEGFYGNKGTISPNWGARKLESGMPSSFLARARSLGGSSKRS